MPGNRLAVNILSLTTAQVIVKLINVAVSIAVVRYLGTDELGRYAYVLAFAFPFGALADFGLGTFAIREMSRTPARESELFCTLQRALAGLAGLGWVALMGAGAVLHYGDSVLLVSLALAGAANVLSAVTTPLLAVLTSREDLHRVAVYQVLASLLGSIAIVAALAVGGATVALLFAATIANLCMWAVAYALVRRLPERVPIPAGPVIRMIREAAPFGLLLVVFALYYRIDTVILQWLRDPREVGLYAAAYKFLDAIVVLAGALGATFYPRFSRLAFDNQPDIRIILESMSRIILVAGVPIVLATLVTADSLVLALFGPEYGESGLILRILILGALPLFLVFIHNFALQSANRVWPLVRVYGVGCMLNVIANVALVPAWGARGAAVAASACEWLTLGLVLLLSGRTFGMSWSWAGTWRYALAAGGMAIVLGAIHAHGVWAAAAAGLAVYAGSLWVAGFLHTTEVVAFRRLFSL